MRREAAVEKRHAASCWCGAQRWPKCGGRDNDGGVLAAYMRLPSDDGRNRRSLSLHAPRHGVPVVAIQNDHAVLRNDVKQPPKAELDFFEIVEDVRMIKLDVVYDHQFRQVMNEFRALIEESRVVLVAFDDKKFRIIQPCTLSEIF